MRVICVIPAFNEEDVIHDVVKSAKRYCDRVIVVDDGSSDKTAELARKGGAIVVRHPFNLGVGISISTGVSIALSENADVIVTMDADGQHKPDDMPKLIEPIKNKKADLVIGSRFLSGAREMPILRRLGNKMLSALISLYTGVKITDSQSGFRAFSRDLARRISTSSIDYRWASELLISALINGFRVVEVPITPIYVRGRRKGAGFFDAIKIALFILRSRRLSVPKS